MNNFLKNMAPPVTRNLIIVNSIVLLAQFVLGQRGIDLTNLLGLHFVLASDFHLWQLVSYMFLHGNLTHLLFNMFALWMFGVVIERTLGQQRFIVYYFVCGIGAGLCQELWQLGEFFVRGLAQYDLVELGSSVVTRDAYLNLWTTVGASGACYGVLLAFGFFYPEQRIMLLFPPIPMKAKYFVAAYAVIELFSAFSSNSNVAHFAHLGGMLFGWALLCYWRRHPEVVRPSYGGGSKPTILQRIRNLFDFEARAARRQAWRPQTGHNTDYDYNLRKKQQEARLDEILDKIKRSGYDSLTEAEKRDLFQNSQR